MSKYQLSDNVGICDICGDPVYHTAEHVFVRRQDDYETLVIHISCSDEFYEED